MFKYKHLITRLLSFIKQLGNGLRTLNTLSQEPDHPENRVSTNDVKQIWAFSELPSLSVMLLGPMHYVHVLLIG